MYLAWKTGRFFPIRATDQFEAIQWLMFQMGGVGPLFGQVHHFLRAAPEPVPYAIERYTKETRRLYGVLNGHLAAPRVSGIAILDRRHRHLSMGRALRVAQGGPERLSRGEALVRPDRRAARGAGRDEGAADPSAEARSVRHVATGAIKFHAFLADLRLSAGRPGQGGPAAPRQTPMSEPLPEQIGKYPIIRELGRGATSVVYLAPRSVRQPRGRHQGHARPAGRRTRTCGGASTRCS